MTSRYLIFIKRIFRSFCMLTWRDRQSSFVQTVPLIETQIMYQIGIAYAKHKVGTQVKKSLDVFSLLDLWRHVLTRGMAHCISLA
jgi:hypothetical protein